MKKLLLLTFLNSLCMVSVAFALDMDSPYPAAYDLIVASEASGWVDAQLFNRAREMYRIGDLHGAARVLKRILERDCTRTVALLRLKEIGSYGPAFIDIADYVANFKCLASSAVAEEPVDASFMPE